MRAQVRYPLLLRGTPKRCTYERDILVSYAQDVDVPEVSASETRTSFEVRRRDGPYTVLSYGDRAYRRLGDTYDLNVRVGLEAGFDAVDRMSDPRFITLPKATTTRYGRPAIRSEVAGPIQNYIGRRMHAEGLGGEKEAAAWPQLPQHTTQTRNEFKFEDYERLLPDIDERAMAEGLEMHAEEAARLLVVDGGLWIADGPPCFMVARYGHDETACVNVELAHIPRWFDPRLDRQYFPLTRHAEALAYAARLQKAAIPEATFAAGDFSHGWSAEDPSEFDFDGERYELARLTCVMAQDAARAASRDPEAAGTLDPAVTAAVEEGRQASIDTNHVIGREPGVSHLTEAVTAGWRALRRPHGYGTIPPDRHRVATMLMERAVSIAQNLPIDINADFETPTP